MNIVVDDIGAVVTRLRPINDADDYGQPMIDYLDSIQASASNRLLMPFYMYGHPLEIANRLLEKDKHKVYKYQKYPLIALKMDFEEPVEDGIKSLSLNIAILNFTNEKYNAEERMTNIFKPVLYPIYKRLMEELRDGPEFFWPGNQEYPEHTKVDRPYWGTANQQGNVKNIFNDPIDAIEIIGLKLKQRVQQTNC